ncbi:hypothetical protein PSYJA_45941, partial [Pseudomonas syringae pv. japonica str. M301072]
MRIVQRRVVEPQQQLLKLVGRQDRQAIEGSVWLFFP